MKKEAMRVFTAFAGARRIGSGELSEVALQAKLAMDRPDPEPVLIFDDTTGETIEVDFRGTIEDLMRRIPREGREDEAGPVSLEFERDEPRGPGRPRLGVVPREVTLLPRHWEWLGSQPGGASVAIRKLVEDARRLCEGKDRVRRSREAAYRFMNVMAGDRPGFEEATRALFAGACGRFNDLVEPWPADLRDHSKKLAAASFEGSVESAGGG